MSKQGDLHIKLQRAFKEAHSEFSAAVAQQKANDVWREIKEANKSFDDLQNAVSIKIQKFEAMKLRKRSSYALFFSKVSNNTYILTYLIYLILYVYFKSGCFN